MPLERLHREPFFRVMNLLARPAVDRRAGADLHALMDDPAWKPLPLPGLHREVLPLIRANAEGAGVDFAKIFADRGESGSPLPSPADCVKACFARGQRLAGLASAFEAAGIGRAVLIKGAALSRFMPSPALRLMCDLDILLPAADLKRAMGACEGAGWTSCSDRAATFRHPSGWTVDLQVPATPLAGALLATARPDGAGPWYLPRPELHAALLAIHCFQGHGERVWRDVADCRLLAGLEGWSAEGEAEALRLARESGEGEALEAFRVFLDFLDGAAPAEESSKAVRDRVELLALMAGEQAPEVTLHLIRQLQRRPGEWLPGLRRPAPPNATGTGGRRPRGLYDLPRRERLVRACGLLLSGAFSPRTRLLFRTCALQRKVSSRSLFVSPAGRCAHVTRPAH